MSTTLADYKTEPTPKEASTHPGEAVHHDQALAAGIAGRQEGIPSQHRKYPPITRPMSVIETTLADPIIEPTLSQSSTVDGHVEGNSRTLLKQLNKILKNLKGDDADKYVGLALLRSILDDQPELRDDPQVIAQCWAAVPLEFLDRLLSAAEYKGTGVDDIADRDFTIGLAVAVIHAFANLLPELDRDDMKLAGRMGRLISIFYIRYARALVFRDLCVMGCFGLADELDHPSS